MPPKTLKNFVWVLPGAPGPTRGVQGAILEPFWAHFEPWEPRKPRKIRGSSAWGALKPRKIRGFCPSELRKPRKIRGFRAWPRPCREPFWPPLGLSGARKPRKIRCLRTCKLRKPRKLRGFSLKHINDEVLALRSLGNHANSNGLRQPRHCLRELPSSLLFARWPVSGGLPPAGSGQRASRMPLGAVNAA